ncbi:hypothetical protein BMT54_04235 [Pasteurellaceae bacterium 15-036681]|nr:hypothetical protein BMT54_04235 [Pasteurellaceae bacterium 15-036681]
MKTLYIHSTNQFITAPLLDKELRTLLKEQGIDARRLSRFTQLALLGAYPLKAQLSENSPIYLASSFSSPSKFNKIFHSVIEQNLPSPLDFMANLNNSATFQLAQSLQTQGATLFLAINEQNYSQPLQLAWLDLAENSEQTALVGWVFEHSAENQQEGSVWFVVSRNPQNALGKIDLDHKFATIPPEQLLPELHNLIEIV